MFTNDWIMRQIELLGAGAARVFKKETKKDEDIMELRPSEGIDTLSEKLNDLVDEGKLCEAEDFLFEYAEEHPDLAVFAVAVEFYATLDKMNDDELLRCDFPREDIAAGLGAIIKVFNN